MIVISTPTGQIGSQVLDGVLGGDEPVRVIARDPSRLPSRVRERVEVVQGSTDDAAVVDSALDGADSVFWLVPPDPHAESVRQHVLDFAKPLCAAIGNRGVKRVVAISSLGRGTTDNAGQVSAIFAMDELIESTGVHYRALCPPGFMENLLRQVPTIKAHGKLYAPMSGDYKAPICAIRDIAAAAVDLLLDGSWTGQRGVPIHGPEDLSHHELARIMTEVLGRPIEFEQVRPEDLWARMVQQGVTEAWARGVTDITAAVERGLYDLDPRTPESSSPTRFRDWCEEVLKPAVLS